MQQEDKRHSQRNTFRQSLELRVSAARQDIVRRKRKVTGLDISSGGVGLETEDELVTGELVKLLVPLGESGASIPVFAEVRWVDLHDGSYRAGLRFLA